MPITLEELRALEDNRRSLDALAARRHQCSPFIGAGLSVASGLPTWSHFLVEEARRLPEPWAQSILKQVADLEYEGAAQSLLDSVEESAFQERIVERFGAPTSGYLRVARSVEVLAQRFSGPIITTNYDAVIEQAFKLSGRELPIAVGRRPDQFSNALSSASPYLIKLHGDAADRTDRVLSIQEYDAAYGSFTKDGTYEGPLAAQLERLFATRSVVFLGCSLNRDRTLDVLRALYKKLPPPPPHFAVVERPTNDEEMKRRRKHLQEHGIKPIWYPPGEYSSVDVIAELLCPNEQASRSQQVEPGLEKTAAVHADVRQQVNDEGAESSSASKTTIAVPVLLVGLVTLFVATQFTGTSCGRSSIPVVDEADVNPQILPGVPVVALPDVADPSATIGDGSASTVHEVPLDASPPSARSHPTLVCELRETTSGFLGCCSCDPRCTPVHRVASSSVPSEVHERRRSERWLPPVLRALGVTVPVRCP